MRGHRRAGASVVEALVALLLGLLVLELGLRGLGRVHAAEGRVEARSGAVSGVRIVRWVLRRELRVGRRGEDWRLHEPDSVRLRAFRVLAFPCGQASGAPPRIPVVYRGLRSPDPDKDSVLLVDSHGVVTAADLLDARASASCTEQVLAAGWSGAEWVFDSLPPDVVFARAFERGSYHLTGSALRYRRGGGGRQPLTPEVFATPPSGFASGAGDAVWVELHLKDGLSGPPVRVPVASR